MRTAWSASLMVMVLTFASSTTIAESGGSIAKEPAVTVPTLLQGTPVMLLLDQTVNNEHAKMGERVAFEVSRDVRVGNRVIIPAGALALGTVTQASHHKLTRQSRVSVNIDVVRLAGGQVVPLSISPDREENGEGTREDSIAASLVPAPVTPHFLSAHRRTMVIPEGTEVRAFVRRDTVIFQQTASVSN